ERVQSSDDLRLVAARVRVEVALVDSAGRFFGHHPLDQVGDRAPRDVGERTTSIGLRLGVGHFILSDIPAVPNWHRPRSSRAGSYIVKDCHRLSGMIIGIEADGSYGHAL